MNFTTLPTRKGKSKFVIYNLDNTTPRAVFEVVNGLVMMTENITPSPHAIPVRGNLQVSTRLDEEQETMVYGRAVAAGMRTIDELVNFLKEQLRMPRLEVVPPDF